MTLLCNKAASETQAEELRKEAENAAKAKKLLEDAENKVHIKGR